MPGRGSLGCIMAERCSAEPWPGSVPRRQQTSAACSGGAPPPHEKGAAVAVDWLRAAAVKGRLAPGAVSPQTSVARGTRRHHRLSLPAGKHAKQTLLLPVPPAAAPLHFQSSSRLRKWPTRS
jgi:hypothetical protein